MPFSQDVLTRIINIQMGGKSVFVIGTYKGKLYYCSPNDPKNIVFETVDLPVEGVFPDRGFFHLSGSSFGLVADRPLFLVCGRGSELSGLSAPNTLWKFFSFICSSADGRTWVQAYKGPQGEETGTFIWPWGSGSNALVYKPSDKKFYHSMLMNKSTPSVTFQHEQIFSSANGTAWEGPITDRSVLFADNGNEIFKSKFPENYCQHNEGFDARNQHLPDGFMSTFSSSKKVAMRPTKPPVVKYTGSDLITYWPEDPSADIEILTDKGRTVKRIEGIEQVTAVGGSGSTWVAGGWNDERGDSGAIAISFDAGKNWKAVAIDSGVVTIAWAPK